GGGRRGRPATLTRTGDRGRTPTRGGRVMNPYPPIADYGLIGDCHGAALVSRAGSIDWCCLPRFDSGSCFGRLLDWESGGHCTVAPTGEPEDVHRAYVDDTLVLATTFRVAAGEARVIDCFTTR